MSDELDIGAYVALRDGFDEVYPRSRAGQRAWIRDRRLDEYDFPEVLIEWDKNDWRYQGESDGWTFESHFTAVDDTPAERSTNLCPHCGHDHGEDANEAYLDELKNATDEALASDGFVMITIREDKDSSTGMRIYSPQVFSAFLTPEASTMIEAQMMYMTSCAYQEEVLRKLNELRNDKGQ